MLVLVRKKDEEIQIGPDVTVKVLWIRGNRVGLGIDAPRSVRILRSEIAKGASDDRGQGDEELGDMDGG